MKKTLFLLLFLIISCSKNYYFPFSDHSYEEFLTLKTNKIKMIDFYNNQCEPCIDFQKKTLNTKEIVDFASKHLIAIKIDAWDGDNGTTVWENEYNGESIPLIIFLDGNNKTIKEVVGKKDKTEFLTILNEVLNRIN